MTRGGFRGRTDQERHAEPHRALRVRAAKKNRLAHARTEINDGHRRSRTVDTVARKTPAPLREVTPSRRQGWSNAMERWLIQSNIVRLRMVLENTELTEAQRRAMERIEAQQEAKLKELERLAPKSV